MVKPVKKLKKILLIMGITGAVYGGFRYLLPLVIPFLLAYAAALWMRPSVRFIETRFCFRFLGKERRLPVWLIGGAELLLFSALLFWGLYLGGKQLFSLSGSRTGFSGWMSGSRASVFGRRRLLA